MFLIDLSNNPQKAGWIVLAMGWERCSAGMTLHGYLWDPEKVK